MSQWKFNGLELEIDLADADYLEKYEQAFEQMAIDEKELQKVGKASEITRSYCKMYTDLFDNIYGEGTAYKLFDGKANATLCEDCYEAFIDACSKQSAEMAARRNKMVSKYTVKRKK